MSVEVAVSWLDAQGESATNTYTVDDAAAALASVILLKALSNAKILAATYSTPIDLATVPSNNAVAANVESAKFKMAVQLSGDKPANATARPGVKLLIPAPLGSLINGLSGDPTNAAFTALLAQIRSNRGETLNKVDRVAYVR